MENLQQPSPQSWMLIKLAILFSFCFSQSSGDLLLEKPQQQQQQNASIDLIQKACNGSLDEDFCISSLKSDPRTITSDPTELTAITIDIAKKNATAVLAYIGDELIANGYYNDIIMLCAGNYQSAVEKLGRADVAFKGGLYPSTSQFIQDAISDVLLCGGKEIKTAPHLAHMSEIMFKLCDNARGVLSHLFKVRDPILPQPQQQPHPLIDLIQKSCNCSLDVDFCISSLTSDPRTISVDPTELTAITIDIAKKNATAVLAYIDDELIANGYYNGSVSLCDEKYQNAVQELGRADAAFKGGFYPSTTKFIQDAISDVLLCGGKEIKTAPPLLAQMSEIVFKLCDNAKGVLSYLSKVRDPTLPQPQQQPHPLIDLIQKSCNGSLDIDFCISSLTSDPRTISTDPKGLTVITIDIAKTNATAVLAYITNELIGKCITNNSISNCQQQYQNVVRQLEQANVDFKAGSYPSTGQLIQNTISDVVLCKGDEILTVAIPPLLTEMCASLLKLCDNARELVCYSSKVCGPKWYD